MIQGKKKRPLSNIKKLRCAAAMSRATLAQLVGVDTQTVGRWERGETMPSADSLMRMRMFFKGVSFDFLLGLESPDATNQSAK